MPKSSRRSKSGLVRSTQTSTSSPADQTAWSYLAAQRSEEAAQGDVFDGVPYFVPLPEGVFREIGRAMVVSHDCEVEKGLLRHPNWPFSIAPLIRIDALQNREPRFVREGKFLRYWALPEEPPLEEGWAVDFDLIQPTVAQELRAGNRLVSIDDKGQEALAGRLLNLISQREFA